MKKIFLGMILALIMVTSVTACGKEELGNLYVDGKDHQYMFEAGDSMEQMMAKGENGYFFLQGKYIYYLPKGANALVPLCNKVDCLHTKESNAEKYEECNAYMGNEGLCQGISYYDGYLYFFKTEFESDYNQKLYRMKEDGSGKEVVYEWEGMAVENWCLHRGEFYYAEHIFTEDEETSEVVEEYSVKKISVDSVGVSKPKLVYEAPEGVNVYILSNLQAYGNYLYFYVAGGTGTVEDSMNEDAWLDYYYGKQVVVNLSTDEIGEIIVPGAELYVDVSTVTFWQDKLVYQGYDHADEKGMFAEGNVYMSELDGSDAKVILEDIPQGFRILTDENYLYLSNTSFVLRGEETNQIYQIYDKNMQLVDTMELSFGNPGDRAIGEAEGFYFFIGKSEDEIELSYFDKNTIGSYQGKLFSYSKIADWDYAYADLEVQ